MNDKQKRARAYLSQIKILDKKAANLSEAIERLRELSTTPKVQAIDGVNIPKKTDEPAFIALLEKIEEREDELAWTLQTHLDLQRQVNLALADMTDGTHILLLIYHYIDYLSWKEIAEQFFVSKATCRRWHEDALDEFRVPPCPIEIINLKS